jgi:site-specific DNA recombinase
MDISTMSFNYYRFEPSPYEAKSKCMSKSKCTKATSDCIKDSVYIDLIITKSVSRFARNTIDSLTTIRKLKEHKVECYFEKENIWTFDSKGELLLTIMSSLAQEESRSISANVTWGQRKRFADGKVTVPFKRFLGYDRGEDGNLVINEGQAAVVRRIYGMFLQGHSLPAIARRLTAEGIPTPGGKTSWSKTTIKSILTNEKYKGDALLQKVYTVDFLSKKKKVNEGEIPQYYVEHSRDAIIDPRVFDQAQRQMAAWQGKTNRHSSAGIFADRIRCGDCGSRYGQKVWYSNDKYRRVVWQCSHKFDGGVKCGTPHLDEAAMKERFVKAVNLLTAEREEIYGPFKEIEEQIFGMGELEARRSRL